MADQTPSGLFLGADLDPATRERTDVLTTYEADRFTTHGVIVGMTGSGKTGLGVVLLEEVLASGVPALIIDPKGDLTNLALNFPDLDAASFRPWIDPAEAARGDRTIDQLAADTAASWTKGLASWGIDAERMRRLREGTRFTIYTPGSTAGVPLNLVGSLAAPEGVDLEALADEVQGFVTGLLGMAGIESDPLTSPEHILLTNLISYAWQRGRDLDLAALLAMVQEPPLRKLGVIDLDTFYPPKDRQALLIRLNGLLASPTFQAWTQGPPADIASMLWAPDGRPSAAIVTLSHLSDQERQFVVTLLFSKLITWMRAQPGTSSLRALAYMDEVFGYVPPNGAPPAKKPILTVLKQARAFGVGLVLSTQNPVDIDYKALSNAGTWMVGRLQTERDKARLLDGMTSASGEVDVKALDATLSALDKRQFVLHSTSASTPRLFTTRWAMSYLRGPMTREQIAAFTADAPERAVPGPATGAGGAGSRGDAAAGGTGGSGPALGARELADDESPVPPQVAARTPTFYLDPGAPWTDELGVDVVSAGTRFQAAIAARVALVYDDHRAGVQESDEWEAVLFPLQGPADWSTAHVVDYDDRDLRPDAPPGAIYQLPNASIDDAKWFREAQSALASHLRANLSLELLRNQPLKLVQRPGETNDAFGLRCNAAADAAMDEEASQIRSRLVIQADRIRAAIEDAEERAEDLRADQRRRQTGNVLQAAGSLLSSFLGGRRSSRKISSAINAAGRLAKQTSTSLDSAERKLAGHRSDLDELEDDLAQQLAELDLRWDKAASTIDTLSVGLDASDIDIRQLAVVWVPVG